MQPPFVLQTPKHKAKNHEDKNEK
jgi:hypothetical protein